MKYETVTICHQLKRKTALWECDVYLSSERICIFLQESLGQWLLIVQRILDLRFITNPKNGRVKALSEACLDRPYLAYQKKS